MIFERKAYVDGLVSADGIGAKSEHRGYTVYFLLLPHSWVMRSR